MEATDLGYLAISVSLVPGTHSSRFQLFNTCDSENAKVYRKQYNVGFTCSVGLPMSAPTDWEASTKNVGLQRSKSCSPNATRYVQRLSPPKAGVFAVWGGPSFSRMCSWVNLPTPSLK